MSTRDLRTTEQLALFVLAFNPERGPSLLEGLGDSVRGRASDALASLQQLSLEDRRTLASVEFGVRKDADLRLRRAMSSASPALQEAVYRLLPSYFRSLFPQLACCAEPGRPPSPPALRAFAKRMAQEALR